MHVFGPEAAEIIKQLESGYQKGLMMIFRPKVTGVLAVGLSACFAFAPPITNIAIACEGGGPEVIAKPNRIGFAPTKVGEAEIKIVTYENIGSAAWKPTGIYSWTLFKGKAGAFNVHSTNCEGSIAPKETCSTFYEFAPKEAIEYEEGVEAKPLGEIVFLSGKGK